MLVTRSSYVIHVAFFLEECAFKVISPYPEVLGLRTVTFIYSHYREEVDIVESICTLLVELAEYGKNLKLTLFSNTL